MVVRRFLCVLAGFLFCPLALASTFTVTSTADTTGTVSGATCTLRQAINPSNASPRAADTTDLINFNIPESGVHTITVTSTSPAVTAPVTIDGYALRAAICEERKKRIAVGAQIAGLAASCDAALRPKSRAEERSEVTFI